jgi:hypothetical protein
MKSLLKPRRKLNTKDYVLIGIIALLSFMIVLLSLAVLVLRSTGIKLKAENGDLGKKVSSLQNDLKSIGENLSGLSSDKLDEGGSNQFEEIKLNRIGILASPGETELSLDASSEWRLLGENRLVTDSATFFAQSEDVDLLTLSNYRVTRIIEPVTVKSGQNAFMVFIESTSSNKGYLSLSFCNPEITAPCSFVGRDGKFVFILAHGFEEGDAFVRDMDFSSVKGIKLITEFKSMMKSLEIR